MGQKDGEKWTAAVDSQPTLPKPDRLLGLCIEIAKADTQVSEGESIVLTAAGEHWGLHHEILQSPDRELLASHNVAGTSEGFEPPSPSVLAGGYGRQR